MTERQLHCTSCGAFMHEYPMFHWTCTKCGSQYDVGWSEPKEST